MCTARFPIDGAELDPDIVAAADTYFHLDEYPNVNAVAADGRSWLFRQPAERKYSVIAVDAYRPPYIPFHLSTVEFFRLVRDHLTENGVVAINVARSGSDTSLVDALAATLAQVFPSVYVVDESTEAFSLGNSLVVATVQPTTLADFERNAAALDPATIPAAGRNGPPRQPHRPPGRHLRPRANRRQGADRADRAWDYAEILFGILSDPRSRLQVGSTKTKSS